MKTFRADLHIHTVLSPCGDLDMSPGKIVSEAALKGIDIIGITDHNTTRHCALVTKMAAEKNIMVLQGAEITTKEEVHCLAFFENNDSLSKFQEFLDANLPEIINIPEKFGHQLQVDENENITYEEKRLLISAISRSFEEVEAYVHNLHGLFIPAHIDKKKNSVYSQLGFLPPNMKADALEISKISSRKKFVTDHQEINEFTIIRGSDSHFPDEIGTAHTDFYIDTPIFSEIRMALGGINGRKTMAE
jgi:3',5'-nucleoside bisphosphate phosphatase